MTTFLYKNKEKYSVQTNEWENSPTYYSNKNVKSRCIVNQDLNKTVNIDNKLVWENVYNNLKYFINIELHILKILLGNNYDDTRNTNYYKY